MTLSQLEQTERRFQGLMLQREEWAVTTMATHYRIAARHMSELWLDSYNFLWNARAAGASPDYLSGAIWHEQRLATMLIQAADIFDRYGQTAGVILNAAVQDAVNTARESFLEQMAVGSGSQVTAGFASFPEQQFDLIAARLSDGSPITDVARRYGSDGPNVVRDALIRGVANGENPKAVARRIANDLGTSFGRASVLTRTEMLRAYRDTTHAIYNANSRIVKGWVWCSAMDERTCPICWAMQGTKHPLADRMATHPCCRCSMVPDLRPWGEIHPALANVSDLPPLANGEESFRKLPAASQIKILGPTSFQAYKRGMLPNLQSLVKPTWSPLWGAGRSQRSLSSVIGPDNLKMLRTSMRPARLAPPKPVLPASQPVRAAPLRAQPITVTPKPVSAGEWRPQMSRAEAQAWADQGDLRRPLFHMTNEAGARGIADHGFDLSRNKWGRVWGNGAYMTDSQAAMDMYAGGFSSPQKLELRVFSRKTAIVDISRNPMVTSGGDTAYQEILRLVDGGRRNGPGALAYTSRVKLYERQYYDFLQELDERVPMDMNWDRSRLQALQAERERLEKEAIAAGRYPGDSFRAKAFTETLQNDMGYDALEIIDNPHRSSVGGCQIIVFDPKRVVMVEANAY